MIFALETEFYGSVEPGQPEISFTRVKSENGLNKLSYYWPIIGLLKQ